ncbi:hypothetical protein Hanom_Chr12g01135811 [Helianthus anomalus]
MVQFLTAARKRVTSQVWNGCGRVRRRVRVTSPPLIEYEALVECAGIGASKRLVWIWWVIDYCNEFWYRRTIWN